MEKQNERHDEEFVELGSVTAQTHGIGTADSQDSPSRRVALGILHD